MGDPNSTPDPPGRPRRTRRHLRRLHAARAPTRRVGGPRSSPRRSATGRSGRRRPPGPRPSRRSPRWAPRAPRLDLGTGVLALQLRTPAGHRDGRGDAPGPRTPSGTSSWASASPPRWSPRSGTARPTATARSPRSASTSTLVASCLSGESVTFDGDFYDVSRFRLGIRLGERRPKIVIGALNPRMLRLAGEIADGVLLNYLPASHVPWSVEQVREGGDATIYAYVHAGVCDRSDGLEPARRDLFSYAVVDAYAAQLRAGRLRRRGGRHPGAPRRRRPRRCARRVSPTA